jgi:phosphatidylserine decarboxylase
MDEASMEVQGSRPRSTLEKVADLTGLNRWFLRRRPIAAVPPDGIIVSPCDSVVQKVSQVGTDGSIEEKNLFGSQRYIHLDEILSLPEDRDRFRNGWYVKQYLSLVRLHYVVFPCAGRAQAPSRRPGKAWPIVIFRSADVRNERMTFPIVTDFGFSLVVIMIGSWNVCGIRSVVRGGVHYQRGDPLGEFRIGSSVVTLFPPETVEIIVGEGERSPMGHPIARVLPGGGGWPPPRPDGIVSTQAGDPDFP